MKHVIAILFSIIGLNQAWAQAPLHPHIDLCVIELEDEDGNNAGIQEVGSVDVKTVKSLTQEELQRLNDHLISLEYIQKPLPLAELQELFKTGRYKYDDLYIITFKVVASDRTYVEYRSYPGDNPYGFIYAENGELIAINSDGSYELLVPGGEGLSCYQYNQ